MVIFQKPNVPTWQQILTCERLLEQRQEQLVVNTYGCIPPGLLSPAPDSVSPPGLSFPCSQIINLELSHLTQRNKMTQHVSHSSTGHVLSCWMGNNEGNLDTLFSIVCTLKVQVLFADIVAKKSRVSQLC